MNRGVVALVTGGASGLGLAAVRHVIKTGGKALIADLPGSKGSTIAQEMSDNCRFSPVDVTDEASVRAALEMAASELGPITAAVSCAGIATAGLTFSKRGPASLDDFQRTINVNLVGTYNVCRLAAEAMSAQEPYNESGERGVLINTASVAAFEGQRGQAAYAASKGGVRALTIVLARDLAAFGIRACTIAPGVILTPMMAGMRDDIKESLAAGVPFPKRLGHPEEYGALAHHIMTNGYLNGETIRMDGALRMT